MSHSITITNQDLIQQLKLSGKLPEMAEGIIARKIITETATEAGIKNTTAELQQAADQFRLANELHNAKDTWNWLQKQGLFWFSCVNFCYELKQANSLSRRCSKLVNP